MYIYRRVLTSDNQIAFQYYSKIDKSSEISSMASIQVAATGSGTEVVNQGGTTTTPR
jgi:hypothetical protein